MSRLLTIMLALSLAACGLKGPLVMPPGPAPTPVLGNEQSAPTLLLAKYSNDVSTDQKASRQ